MRLEHFLYVVEIAKHRSLSKAARNLYITQPSLSVSLQNLENELGFQVFERSHKGMVLTEKGREFYQIAKRIKGELDRVDHLVAPEDNPAEVHLNAAPVFCNAAMLQLISSVRGESQEIQLSINECTRASVLDAVVERQADLGIGICIDGEEKQLYQNAQQCHVMIEPLIHDRMYLYIPKHHTLAFEESIPLARLQEDGIIVLKEADKNAHIANHKGGYSYTFAERDSVIKAVSKGMGYAVLPGMMAIDNVYIEAGLVNVVPIADGVIPATMYLAFSSAEPLTKNQALVAQHIRTVSRHIQQRLDYLPKLKHKADKTNLPLIYY